MNILKLYSKLASIIIIILLIVISSGCIQESGESIEYNVCLKFMLEYNNGLNNETEKFDELKYELSKNDSIEIEVLDQNKLKLNFTDWKSLENITFNNPDMYGNISIREYEIKVNQKLHFFQEDIVESNLSESEIDKKTNKLLMKNLNWTLNRIENIYNAEVEYYTEDSSINHEI